MSDTNDDKRARALERLSQPDAASLSDRAIAAELGVSQPFISSLRRMRTAVTDDDAADNIAGMLADYARQEESLHEERVALQQQQRDITDQVVRGRATQAELAAPGQRLREIETELQEVEALRRAASHVAREHEAAQTIRRYYQALDQYEVDAAAACASAARIDELVEQLGAEYAHCDAVAGRWRNLAAAADETTNRRLAEVLRNIARPDAVMMTIASRLVGVGLDGIGEFMGGRVDQAQRAQRVAPVLQIWTSDVIRVARMQGPRETDK